MALGRFKILAGDFKVGKHHQLAAGKLFLKRDRRWFRQTVSVSEVLSVERASTETVASAERMIGWGVAGALVAGPLGAAAAGFVGSKSKEVTFVCQLKDGRKFLGVMPSSLFADFYGPFQLAEFSKTNATGYIAAC